MAIRKYFKIISLILTLGLVVSQQCAALNNQTATERNIEKTIQVTYVANTGFLIKTGDKKILMDGIFGGFEANWCDVPPRELTEKIIHGKAPFDNIDLVTVSHRHMDHFNVEMMMEFLTMNKNTHLACPEETVEKLKILEGYDKLESRIHSIPPGDGNSGSYNLKGIDVKGYNLDHGPYWEIDEKTGKKANRHGGVQNTVFVLSAGGIKFLHSGDWNFYNIEDNGIVKKIGKIDLAFLDRGILFQKGEERLEIFKKYISPEKIIIMHLSPGAKVTNNEKINKYVWDNFIVFKKRMDKKILEF